MYKLKVFFLNVLTFLKTSLFKKNEVIDRTQIRVIPKGHAVFKYNLKSKALTLANCFMQDGKKTVTMEEGCIYVSGLNRTIAIKKLAKIKAKVVSGDKQQYKPQPKGHIIYFKQPNDAKKSVRDKK